MNLKQIVKTPVRDAVFTLGSWYYRLSALEPIWRLKNWNPRRLYRRYAPELRPAEAALALSLAADGVAVCHMDDLFPPEVFQGLLEMARARWSAPEVASAVRERAAIAASGEKPKGVRKFFLVDLWDGPRDPLGGRVLLDPAHPFIRFSLADPILRIVAAYLGMLSKFRFWHLEATIPAGRVGPLGSQRWHRDPEDQKLVKVFLYLSDVDDSSGPFTYLAASHASGRWRHLFPLAPPRGSLPMPPDEDRFIPKEGVREFAGRAGTIIFCDTTGLHRGGLARESPRLMYTSVYTSPASPWPIRYAYPSNFNVAWLSPLARFAVANRPHQRPPKYFR